MYGNSKYDHVTAACMTNCFYNILYLYIYIYVYIIIYPQLAGTITMHTDRLQAHFSCAEACEMLVAWFPSEVRKSWPDHRQNVGDDLGRPPMESIFHGGSWQALSEICQGTAKKVSLSLLLASGETCAHWSSGRSPNATVQ